MPTVTINKSVFEKLVGKELPLEQLKDRISMLGTDLEGIEGNEINVEIFPNRPDLLSEQGLARAFSSFIGVKTGLRKYQVTKEKDGAENRYKVIVEESVKDVRPFTACAIVKGLNFDEEKIREIIQIQEKLHVTYGRNRKKAAIGIYPLDKIRFPVYYRADLPEKIRFRPLEAGTEMTGEEILKEHKTGIEFAHLLKDAEVYPFFIDNKNNILSMPPIINSHETGRITEQTKDVFIECSGHDFRILSICINIISAALADMGGNIFAVNLEYPAQKNVSPDFTPEEMSLDLKYINKRLGLKLSEEEAIKLLARMGFGYEQERKKVLIPAYRADILHQVDLVEDIAIAYGYENFEEQIPNVATIGEELSSEKFYRVIKEVLIGNKMLEVKNYHLMTQEDLVQKMNLDDSQAAIPLKNALGDHNHLRNSIIPSLLKVLSENQHNEYPQNIFEIGRIFVPDDEKDRGKRIDTGIIEKDNLSIALCHDKTDFTEIRQIIDLLGQSLNFDVAVKESEHPSFIQGRVGRIFFNGKEAGIIGEIYPKVLTDWGIMMPVVMAEINLEVISSFVSSRE